MTRTSKDRTAELSRLKDRCLAIARFIGEVSAVEDGVSEHLSTQMEAAIQAGFERGDLGGLKMFSRDLNEWVSGMAATERAKLDDILGSQFGEDPRGAESDARNLARILQRGTIEDEDEYRMLVARADEIYADGSKSGELKKINELLAAFEEKLKQSQEPRPG